MTNKSGSHEEKNHGKMADEKNKMQRKSSSRSDSTRDEEGSKMPRTNYNSDMKAGGKNFRYHVN